LNLRPPRPERGAPTISKRKSPEATHVAERHRNDWFGAGWSSRAGPLRLNAAPIHLDINSRKQIGSESEKIRYGIQWCGLDPTFNNGSPPMGTKLRYSAIFYDIVRCSSGSGAQCARQLIDRSTLHWRSLVTWRGLIRRMSGYGMPGRLWRKAAVHTGSRGREKLSSFQPTRRL
jgi:hypothetical protein